MSKINIIYKIKNNDNIKSDKVRAIFLDGIITYNEDGSLVKEQTKLQDLNRAMCCPGEGLSQRSL